MENTSLCHVPVGTFFQLDGAQSHFLHHVRAFLDTEFPDGCIGRVEPPAFPGSLVLQI